MEQVFAAFPKRPLRITWFRQTIGAKILAIFGLLCLAALYAADLLYIMPAVIDDVRYSDAPYVPGKFEDGSCQSKLIISICDVKLKYRPDETTILDKEITMLLTVTSLDSDRPFVVHMAPGRPDHISTSWGQGAIVDRVIAQIAVSALVVVVLFAGMRERKRQRDDAAARQRIGQRPQATSVTVVQQQVDKRSGTTFVTYTWDPAGKPQQKKKARFPKGTAPFMLDSGRVLALTDGTDVAILDSKLANVDLSEQEREAIIKAKPEARSATA